jgi:tetratricopeptide (TPR) repeat protein
MNEGDLIADRFLLDRVAGSGGMGTVWRAIDRLSGQPVALKVTTSRDSAVLERFEREVAALSGIVHPAVVGYVAHGQTEGGEPFVAMQWLDGEDLEQRLAREPLSLEDAYALGLRLAEALGAAHAKGFVHRDVKPSNVVLVNADIAQAVLVDFGIARLGAGAAHAVTQRGTLVGTPGYMAPEQARGEAHLTAAVDVFALGCVLYECMTARAAFVGHHAMAILAKVLLDDVTPPSEWNARVSPAHDALMAAMLAKDPLARPPNGAAVAHALATIAHGEQPKVERPTTLGRNELRLVSVIVAAEDDASGATLTPEQALSQRAPFDSLMRVERLALGGRVAVLVTEGAATDAARHAVRAALAMRQTLGSSPIAVATGRAMVEGRLPVGEVIDRAAAMLALEQDVAKHGGTRGVRLDNVTAGLVDARFDVEGDAAALYVVGERAQSEPVRTLLGKPTPCVGRERDIATLTTALDACIEESRATCVLVTAPAGVGKSRVLHEWVTRMLARGTSVEVWMANGDPQGGQSAFGLLGQMLRGAASVRLGEPPDQARAKLRARVARHVVEGEQSRITLLLGEIVGVPFPDDDSALLRVVRRDEQRMSDQLMLAWLDFAEAQVRAQPLLLVIDDLQWGDGPTVRFVDAALRVLHDRPLMVVAFARPDVADVFPSLWGERSLQSLPLRPLGDRASAELVRDVLGTVSDASVARIVSQAAGSALLLEELIRAETEGRGSAAPETVLAILQARLEALPDAVRRVLRAASVFGTSFWTGGVAALVGGDDDETSRSLQLLGERELVIARPHGRFAHETELVFRHPLVREAAYTTLVESDRVLGHRLAAGWLAKVGERDAATLAEHFEKGGDPASALPWWRRAAEEAFQGSDLTGAIARAERAIACGAAGETLGRLRLLQARVHRWRGDDPETAKKLAREALEVLPEGGDAWFETVGELAVVFIRAGAVDELVAVAERLCHALPLSDAADAARGANAARFASGLWQLGRRSKGDELLAIAEAALTRHPDDPILTARVCYARGVDSKFRGAIVESLAADEEARRAWASAGDVKELARMLVNIGDCWMNLGRYADALVVLNEALVTTERLGLHYTGSVARNNVVFTLARRGETALAIAAGIRTVREFVEQGATYWIVPARAYLADALRRHGDLARAESEVRAALDNARDHPIYGLAATTLAEILLARGDHDGALASCAKAFDVLDSGGFEEGEARLRLVHAETLHARGDLAGAVTAIDAGRERVLANATAIDDPALRQSFLENIEEHARILKLAAAWHEQH